MFILLEKVNMEQRHLLKALYRVWDQIFDGMLPWQFPWWRHQMKTFSALLALCAGNSRATPATGKFPSQRPVTRSFDFFLSAPEQTIQ